MDAVQVFICLLIGLLLGYLYVTKRKDKKKRQATFSSVISGTSREYVEQNLIPTMCLEDLDKLLIYDDTADTRLLISRGYLLNRAVSGLQEIVAKLEPDLSYLGHVVLRDSKIKFDAGVGNYYMLYYKPVGVISTVLLKVEVDFTQMSPGSLIFKFSGPLALDIQNMFEEDCEDLEVDTEVENEELETVS